MSVLPKVSKRSLMRREHTRHDIHFNKRGASLGLVASDTPELIRQLEAGFSFHVLRQLEANTGLDHSLLATIIGIPERTLARRRNAGKFAPEESERLLRISRIFENSVELFDGDIAAAVDWLMTPKTALDNVAPLLYSRTEVGAREVEALIGRLEHGVFS